MNFQKHYRIRPDYDGGYEHRDGKYVVCGPVWRLEAHPGYGFWSIVSGAFLLGWHYIDTFKSGADAVVALAHATSPITYPKATPDAPAGGSL